MKKEKENPNHHMGKETGYDLIDGEYHIAPLYQQQFSAIEQKEVGIKKILEIVTSHAADDLGELNALKRNIWNTLAADIGLDLKRDWTYRNGVVTEIKKEL